MPETKTKTIRRSDLNDIANYVNGTVNSDYSGRGMHGQGCAAILTSRPLQVGYAIATTFMVDGGYTETDEEIERIEIGERLAHDAVSDSMGLHAIVYFPGWTVAEADD